MALDGTLIVGSGSPTGMRRPYIHENELFSTCETGIFGGCVWRGPGDFDLPSYLRMMPQPWNRPQHLVTLFGIGSYVPRNIAHITGYKILIVDDTHHGKDQLTKAVRTAISEPYDLVVLQYTPHHVHWFLEAGCRRVAYINCYGLNPVYLEPRKDAEGVVFVGQVGPIHVRRRRILAELKAAGIPVKVIHGYAPPWYNSAAVSLNISLNGDCNLRENEIVAAGGCLVQVEEVTDENLRLIRELCSDPEKRWQRIQQQHMPTVKERMDALAAELALPMKPQKPPPDEVFWARLAHYEACQELRRLDVALPWVYPAA